MPESRYSSLFFSLSGHGPAGSGPTAESADRAALYDFRRFPAVIQTLDAGLQTRFSKH